MLCIACHYMKRGDSAFFTDPDNMNFRMMMYFFWGSVAYAFWNFSIWQKKMQRRDNEKYTKQTTCVIAFLVSEIIVCTIFFSSFWILGLLASTLFCILCIISLARIAKHPESDKSLKTKSSCLIVCLLLFLHVFTWLNLSSRRDVLLPAVQCTSIEERGFLDYYSLTFESQQGVRYRVLCPQTVLTDADIEASDFSESYEVRFKYSFLPPHFGVLHSIHESSLISSK